MVKLINDMTEDDWCNVALIVLVGVCVILFLRMI